MARALGHSSFEMTAKHYASADSVANARVGRASQALSPTGPSPQVSGPPSGPGAPDRVEQFLSLLSPAELAELRRTAGAPLVSLSHSTQASLLRQLGWHDRARDWDGRALARAGTDPQARADALYRRTIDNSAVGMCLIAPDGRFMEVNDALCRFFGYLLAGRMDECEAFCRASYERTLDDPLPLARATWAHALGKTALHAGRLDAARVNLHESIALLQGNDNGTLAVSLFDVTDMAKPTMLSRV